MSKIKEIFDYYFSIISTILLLLLISGVCFIIYKDIIKKEENISPKNTMQIAINEEKTDDTVNNDKKEIIKVDIKGAVKKNGVYELEKGQNVSDLIEKAGGLTKNATTSNVNLSRVLEDQMVVNISTKSELKKIDNQNISECVCPEVEITKCEENSVIKVDGDNVNAIINDDTAIEVEEKANSSTDTKSTLKVSLNNATKEELMTLTGVGESKAIAIIDYREKNGKYTSIEDIKNVSGIGDALFEKIKSYITL